MNYMVFFEDWSRPSTFYFNTLSEPDHYARLNAGCVKNVATDEVVARYYDEDDYEEEECYYED